MKINSSLQAYQIYQKNNLRLSHTINTIKNKGALVNFKGQSYPSGYYTDKEIEYAKKYLCVSDWEAKLRSEHMSYLCQHMNGFKYVFTSAPEKETERYIRQVRQLMIDLNNEKIREAQKRQKEAQLRQKQLEAELKKREAEKNEKLRKEQLNAKIKDKLTTHFINPLKDNSEQTPTVILVESKNRLCKDEIFEWLKKEISGRIIEFQLPKNEDDALYRLNIELQYAQDYNEKTKKRTVLFISDFSHILKNSEVSNETIADMKAFLFALSDDKEPITIIFDVPDTKGVDSAFLKNKRRIPLQLNFDDLILGQKKDWKLHLSDGFKNIKEHELEIYKYNQTNLAKQALEQGDIREVIRIKETLALLCEMQGKNRDAYLLRCDIDNYLKKI